MNSKKTQKDEMSTSEEDALLQSPSKSTDCDIKKHVEEAAKKFAAKSNVNKNVSLIAPAKLLCAQKPAIEQQQNSNNKTNLVSASSSTTTLTPHPISTIGNVVSNEANVAGDFTGGATTASTPVKSNVSIAQPTTTSQAIAKAKASEPNSSAPTTSTPTGSQAGARAKLTQKTNTKEVNEREQSKPKKKKTRRGGSKAREARERKAQLHENAGASTSTLNKQNTANTNKVASTSAHMTQTATMKRSLQHGDTPPEVIRDSKVRKGTQAVNQHSTTQKPTMAEVVSDANLLVALIDMPVPDVVRPLSLEQYNKVHGAITTFMFAELNKGIPLPSFSDNKYIRGHMRIRCSTPGAKAWLSNAIQYIPALWEGMSLKLVDHDKIPQPKKVLGLFRNCFAEPSNICKMLDAMNVCIDMSRWTILSTKQSKTGTHIAFGMGEDQHEVIRSNRFKLFFGAGCADFKDISPENQNKARTEHEEEMESQSDQEDEVTIIQTDQEMEIEEGALLDTPQLPHITTQPGATQPSTTANVSSEVSDNTNTTSA